MREVIGTAGDFRVDTPLLLLCVYGKFLPPQVGFANIMAINVLRLTPREETAYVRMRNFVCL